MQFERRKVKRFTGVVVDGQYQFDNLFELIPSILKRRKQKTTDRAEGKRAETYFNSIK